MSASDLRELAKRIRECNRWRRGEGKYGVPGCPPPETARQFGLLFDEVATVLESNADQFRDATKLVPGTYEEPWMP